MKTKEHLNVEGMQVLSGKKSYGFDFEDGDGELTGSWFATGDITVWLIFSGLKVPYSVSRASSFSLRVENCKAVEITADPKTHIAAVFSWRRYNGDHLLDRTPVELVPPSGAQLQLSALVTDQVREQLRMMGVETEIEIDENEFDDDEDLDADTDDMDFGPGFMEDELPGGSERAVEPPSAPGAADSGGGGSESPGPAPESVVDLK